jgi:hypothetical protein
MRRSERSVRSEPAREDARIVDEMGEPAGRQGDEPDRGDREAQRDDEGLERRRRELQLLAADITERSDFAEQVFALCQSPAHRPGCP